MFRYKCTLPPHSQAGFHGFSYSYLRDSAGLAWAARIVWKLTVMIAITRAMMAASTRVHHWKSMRYAKFWSQLSIRYQLAGMAIRAEISIHLPKSFHRCNRILPAEAPCTFLIPISLVRCSVVKATSPSSPSAAMKRAIMENRVITFLVLISFWYS